MVRESRRGKAFPAMVMSPKDIAELGCAARLRGESLANRALSSGTQLLPRKLVRALGGMVNVRGWGSMASASYRGEAAAKEVKK